MTWASCSRAAKINISCSSRHIHGFRCPPFGVSHNPRPLGPTTQTPPFGTFGIAFRFLSQVCNAFLGRLDAQRRIHRRTTPITQPTPTTMSSNAHDATDTSTSTPAHQSVAGEAFPGLPNHLVVAHILRSRHFDDPADLARLPAVSRAIRDGVAATELRFKELDELSDYRVADLGCLSVLKRRQRRGDLSYQEYLCQAAARSGQLEELKILRAIDTPWNVLTCYAAARGGHLEVLQ